MQVYLFELDSVRTSDREAERGQRAIFEEISRYGNRVILTFNQLVDSRSFFSLLTAGEATYQAVLKLFELGALRVSLYGKYRTASQYIQDQLKRCLQDNQDTFLFSGLPVKGTERALLGDLLQALRYSDFSILEERLQRTENDADQARLDYLLRFVKLVLFISSAETSNNPAAPPGETMDRFLDREVSLLREDAEPRSFSDCRAAALEVIGAISAELQAEDPGLLRRRSVWYNALYRMSQAQNGPSRNALALAEALVDLAYNYSNECSVSAVSLHYGQGDFQTDFFARLTCYWEDGCQGIHRFLKGDVDDPVTAHNAGLNWTTLVRLVEDNIKDMPPSGSRPVYEAEIASRQRRWRACILRHFLKRIVRILLYIVLFIGVEFAINFAQDAAEQSFGLVALSASVLSMLIFGVLSTAVSTLLHCPDILDDLKNLWLTITDIVTLARVPSEAYHRKELTQ